MGNFLSNIFTVQVSTNHNAHVVSAGHDASLAASASNMQMHFSVTLVITSMLMFVIIIVMFLMLCSIRRHLMPNRGRSLIGRATRAIRRTFKSRKGGGKDMEELQPLNNQIKHSSVEFKKNLLTMINEVDKIEASRKEEPFYEEIKLKPSTKKYRAPQPPKISSTPIYINHVG
ncbi:ORF 5b [Beluga whale coronavirus SW1]|uniref:ORF 5b n=1 Tax=Beluga whale coronavirus (strain SW1) TaxID=694015 RepID=B2BW37_BWCOV|nr:ORF 5b [Beluga whale coronavirus SW1]ABW87824.1 ORF 5b [Beluga whale coronavirus SW1]